MTEGIRGGESAPEARIGLRATREADLDFVLGLERHPENTPFIGQWSREEHADAIARKDREHWLVVAPEEPAPLGYLIAYDLTAAGCGAYVKRIVVAGKGAGVGRGAVRAFADHAFSELGASHVWLSVYASNLRGQRCYRAGGFERFRPEPGERDRHHRAAGNRHNEDVFLMILRRGT